MITVYWCKGVRFDRFDTNRTPDFVGIRNKAPTPVRNILKDKYNVKGQYNFCPAYRNHLTNLYSVNSPFDYNLRVENEMIKSDYYDQKFFDEYVYIRSLKERLITLNNQYMFITDSDDLELSLTQPYLDSNDFSDNIVAIPATFNIGKWPRYIECAFHMKRDNISVKEGEPMIYIKFHTDEKIIFKNFVLTPMMIRYMELMMDAKEYKQTVSPLKFFYDLMGSKKNLKYKMLKEAKKNVID